MSDGFSLAEGFYGGTSEDYDPKTVASQIAIPLRVDAPTVEAVQALAMSAAEHIGNAVDQVDGVAWITDMADAAQTFLANAATALEKLTLEERAVVLGRSAAMTRRVRELTQLWVIRSKVDAKLYVAPGPGTYGAHGNAHRATDADLAELEAS